jgi:hypothetical protein
VCWEKEGKRRLCCPEQTEAVESHNHNWGGGGLAVMIEGSTGADGKWVTEIEMEMIWVVVTDASLPSSVPVRNGCSDSVRRSDKRGQSCTVRNQVQSIVAIDGDGYKGKVAYRSSDWSPKAIVHVSRAKFGRSTRLASPEEGGGRGDRHRRLARDG